jgi:hypothetical protein
MYVVVVVVVDVLVVSRQSFLLSFDDMYWRRRRRRLPSQQTVRQAERTLNKPTPLYVEYPSYIYIPPELHNQSDPIGTNCIHPTCIHTYITSSSTTHHIPYHITTRLHQDSGIT